MARRYTGGFISANEQITDSTSANGIYTLAEAQVKTSLGEFPLGDFVPQRSLRFKATASSKLFRNISSTGSQTRATISVWFKRAKITNQTGASQEIFSHKISSAGSNSLTINLNSSTDRINFLVGDTGNNNYNITTTQVFRDTSAWYHLVYAIDSTASLASDRMRVWINGQRITSFSSTSYPPQNATLRLSDSSLQHSWGVDPRDNTWFEGYLSEAYFIDGQSLDATSFGRTNPITNTWVPIRYTGTFGTNGSYLNFSDISSTTSSSNTGIGRDYSGNGNFFTSSNITISGGDYWDWDYMNDVPGLGSVNSLNTPGNQSRGNYPIVNWNWKSANIDSTQSGQYVYNNTSSDYHNAWFTTVIPPAGKYYWEVTLQGAGDVMGMGIAPVSQAHASNALLGNFVNESGKTPGLYSNWQGAAAGFFADGAGDYITLSTNDVINFAYDAAAGSLWIGRNGTYYTAVSGNHGTTIAGIGRPSRTVDAVWRNEGMVPYFMAYNGTGIGVRGGIFNFGQKTYRYTPPAGFLPLCNSSMPDPVIKRPEQHFDVKTFVGNGSSITVGTTAKQTSAHRISKSVELDPNLESFFSRTPASAGNRRTWTWSAWVKLANLASDLTGVTPLFSQHNTGQTGARDYIQLYENKIWVDLNNANNGSFRSTPIIRDPAAWYHFVWSVDTTQLGTGNRVKFWVNGIEVAWDSASYPSQNYETFINLSGTESRIGAQTDGVYFSNCYISEVNFIDGQALTATAFGNFDANNNWMPKRYTGTYGTNGFFLPFSDDRNTTTLGYDLSGNGNNWTPNNILAPVPNSAPNVLYYGTPGTYTWTAPTGVTSVNYLVVAGGGAGGAAQGGGGGAGGMLTGTLSVTPGTSYTVTVGAGGLPAPQSGKTYSGLNGGNSVFASITSVGGGFGAGSQTGGGASLGDVANSGGSGGGGASFVNTVGTQSARPTPGNGTAGQGNTGGSTPGSLSASGTENRGCGGGGGGAGAVGGNGDSSFNGGAGGAGLASSITGVSSFYAGGGGGGCTGGSGLVGQGGIGGGGRGGGSNVTNTTSTRGVPGTGGGGGGGGSNRAADISYPGRDGGSGVVILSYTNASSYIGPGAESSIFNGAPFDTPTDYDDGTGAVRGNYAVMDPRTTATGLTYSSGNLEVRYTGTDYPNIFPTIGNQQGGLTSGKYYFEMRVTRLVGQIVVVVQDLSTGSETGYYNFGNRVPSQSYGATYTVGDTIGVALDLDNGEINYYKNNVAQGIQRLSSNSNRNSRILVQPSNADFIMNFGQNGFTYAPPSGFRALNTKSLKDFGSFNLPDSFGNFVNTPDLVWVKNRQTANNHLIQDTVRGTGVYSDVTTGPHNPLTSGIQAFLPNGFQVGSVVGANGSGNGIVSWVWNRGRTPGFDVISYGGNGAANQTIAHNLGTTPKVMIIKSTTTGVASWNSWNVWHASLPNGAQSYLRLNETAVTATSSAVWGNAAPGSTTFSVGNNAGAGLNGVGDTFIAYLWAEVPGFSSFGSYRGNGSSNGPFIYTGFRPKYVLVKRTDASNNWIVQDSVRNPSNPVNLNLLYNDPAAENTNGGFYDFNSNGFKCRTTDVGINASGGSYVYMAFAECPFKYANAR